MPYELKEIKEIRKKFGLTQSELANKSGVSQSLIAKIESERIDPTFSKTKKIFETLDTLHEKHELKAGDVMQQRLVSLTPNDSLQNAVKKMKKYEISQLPVLEKNEAVGIISESIILDVLIEGKKDMKIKDVMNDSPPIIPKKSSITVVTNLLKYYPMVLVSDSGKIKGVITKSDLIDKIARV